MQARLSPNEKAAIEKPPTTDLAAFDLYTRAKNLILTSSSSGTAKADLLQAIELLKLALVRDPPFFDAYCQLADAHGLLYLVGYDHASARRALAEAAVPLPLGYGRVRAKRTWQVREIFTKDIAITLALWLSWNWRDRRCRTMPASISSWVLFSAGRQGATKKLLELSSTPSI